MAFAANAQYWFGPKVGIQRTDHYYQNRSYRDTFNIKPDYNFQAGIMMTYTANKMYSVHTEINYERIGKKLSEVPSRAEELDVKSRFHFINIPLMLRMNFRSGPYQFYVNGGPRISYWLAGKVEYASDAEWEEPFGTGHVERYKIAFNEASGGSDDKKGLERANRIQYALSAGFGVNLDLRNESRLMLDFRYVFGHSNMGFNGSQELSFNTYAENVEYTHNTLSISVGYMIEYNEDLKRKGKSTNKESNQ
ncbi:MAG: PorT family protein [Cyclobacteriaceae bacterium]|nr:PorT family protein [Cyclobacteriaceae bacterium HetDA_MAG_MS6]